MQVVYYDSLTKNKRPQLSLPLLQLHLPLLDLRDPQRRVSLIELY